MHWLDILISVPLAFLAWKGFRKGAIAEVAALAGLCGGLWAASHLSCQVVEALHLQGDSAVLIAFFIAFAGVVVLAYLLGKAAEGLLRMAHAGLLNKLLGALLGMAKGVCLLSVLLYYLSVIDQQGQLLSPEAKEKSVLYQPVARTGDGLIGNLKQYVDSRSHAGPDGGALS